MRDCWVLLGFGPDPYCPQRPSCRPLARADLCALAGFDHENSCFVKYKSEPLTACTSKEDGLHGFNNQHGAFRVPEIYIGVGITIQIQLYLLRYIDVNLCINVYIYIY